MSKVADSIRRGLEEAVAYARDETRKGDYRVRVPARVNVRTIRTKLGMTQEEFAGRFGFSVNTLRHWKQGKGQPGGPTRAYLIVIERAPKAVQAMGGELEIPAGFPGHNVRIKNFSDLE